MQLVPLHTGEEPTATQWNDLAVNAAMRDAMFCLAVECLLKVVYTGMYQGANASVINPRAYMIQHGRGCLQLLNSVCVTVLCVNRSVCKLFCG
jgi:hypothetical protein